MRSSLQKAGDWFDLENYKRLNKCPDFTLLKFLLERAELYWNLSAFVAENSEDSAFLKVEMEYICEKEPAYRKIKAFDVNDYLACGHGTDEAMDAFGWTPGWLKDQGYSCSAVRPLSVSGVICLAEDVADGTPEGYSEEEFVEAVAEARERYRHDEFQSPELESISIDQYLREAYEYHSGLAALNIDLTARDDQIISELKELLPRLRKLLQVDPERSRNPTHKEQLFLGPSPQKRDTRRIDLTKVRDYRVPALIDLYIWSAVEEVNLSSADYLRLVFPGDTGSDARVSEENIKKTYLPYAFRCMDFKLLAALDRSLERDRKSGGKNSNS
ncbi:DUF6387 family protein [Microbulbifer magnicolonia]|uniref:DUF6387 family protein n=1 Tax=Microbulbifer magnicolonia TaxID=3109744 RepID=UPI002B40152A|nr:DUF6387 family protein [Microbulbifer sp. GG15]